ncbi:phosphate starvation-inducible protein PhoH and related proteins [Mariprofundus micogutta]|uniref:PhoH-like protein n=1 Tax=Mariprofundus micogutta TaxID=1921010 RepID=A0A1L8CMD2_9PROT|nr:PhoH family protein [Mariprofundus micogutta]GAV20055.1 phosphate starvation-inducible protein PhoH and related proteins [Mariprofundus micogutta]
MTVSLNLKASDSYALQDLCGADNWVLKRIEQQYQVRFLGLPGDWKIEGAQAELARETMYKLIRLISNRSDELTHVDIEGALKDHSVDEKKEKNVSEAIIIAGRRRIGGKTPNQRDYLKTIQGKTLTLAVGPAGSGKTYLAVAAAVAAINSNQVERIILTRPAVEAGERLGFLPGDLQQKVDPYLRPLFDALTDMLGVEKMNAMLEQNLIEVAPLAYMRGRTLNDAFVILDEAQNTTREQMKMFLTRLGFGSKMVVTGDVTQVDLPRHQHSGLLHALQVLEHVSDIGVCRLSGRDVVRHQLVEHIVNAYEGMEKKTGD